MIEQELKIVAIEGDSFSGKTTLAKAMQEKYSFGMVEEYDFYTGGGSNFPSFPPESYQDAKKAIDYFIEIEKRRSGNAIETALRTNKGLLMDRSFYSCISFQHVVRATMPEVPNAYLYSIESFAEYVGRSEIVLPPALIYLEPESSFVFRKRLEKRGHVAIRFLNEQKSFNVMRLWYYDLIRKHYTNNNGIVIKSLEDRLEINLQDAESFISSANFGIDRVAILSGLSKLQ